MINKIILGDSYELIKKMPDKSVDCIYTDIPYEMSFSGGGSLGYKLKDYIKEEVSNFSSGIDYSILEEFVRISKNINIFIWCSKDQIIDIGSFFKKYDVNFNILTWTKTNPVPFGNSSWLSDIEYCLHFSKNVDFNIGTKFKRKNYTSATNRRDKQLYNHPTIKPLDMVKNHLLNMTKEGDLVFDPFLGSGTTAVAAKELNRNYLGFEIDEKYYQVATDRLNGISRLARETEERNKQDGISNIFEFI